MASELADTTIRPLGLPFDKGTMGSRKRTSSGASSMDLFDSEEKVRVAPTMGALSRALKEDFSPNLFDERYMSSEEALSLTEPDMDLSDGEYDIDELLDDSGETKSSRSKRTSQSSTIELAVAVTIVLFGRAKVINIPALPRIRTAYAARKPSPSSQKQPEPAPSTSSHSEQHLAEISIARPVPSTTVSDESTSYYDTSFDEVARPLSSSLTNFNFQFGSVANRKSIPRIDTAPAGFHYHLSPTRSHADLFASQLNGPARPDSPKRSRLKSLSHKLSMLSRKHGPLYPMDKSGDTTGYTHSRRGSFSTASPASPLSPARSNGRKLLWIQTRDLAEQGQAVEATPDELAPASADRLATPSIQRPESDNQRLRHQRRMSLLRRG